MSASAEACDKSGDEGETFAVRLPLIDVSQVHASRKDAQLDRAVELLITPFVDHSGAGAAPLLSALHLASNVAILPSGSLSGFVALVAGNAPIAPLLSGDRLGTGTTWFRLQKVNDETLVKGFASRETPNFSLSAIAPEGKVTIVKGNADLETVFYLVVDANDAKAAGKLRKAAQNSTVRDVVTTDGELKSMYSSLFKSSRELRNGIATQFAAAHGLAIDTAFSPGDMDTNIIQFSSLHSERSSKANADAYLVYDNVIDTNEAHSGVLVHRGPIAGYVHIAGRQHTVQSKLSLSWDNSTKERKFSMFPADTGLYLGSASGRIPDRHPGKNRMMLEASKERIRWSGPVKSYNPRAEVIFHSPNDAFLVGVHSALGAAPGGSVEFTQLDSIVTEIPGLDPKEQTVAELVEVLDRSKETALPVKTNGSMFLALLENWPAVRQAGKVKTLSEVFAGEKNDYVMVPDHVIRTVAQVCKTA